MFKILVLSFKFLSIREGNCAVNVADDIPVLKEIDSVYCHLLLKS